MGASVAPDTSFGQIKTPRHSLKGATRRARVTAELIYGSLSDLQSIGIAIGWLSSLRDRLPATISAANRWALSQSFFVPAALGDQRPCGRLLS
jgi:hypothetical protein